MSRRKRTPLEYICCCGVDWGDNMTEKALDKASVIEYISAKPVDVIESLVKEVLLQGGFIGLCLTRNNDLSCTIIINNHKDKEYASDVEGIRSIRNGIALSTNRRQEGQ